MERLHPSKKLSLESGNFSKNWRRWEQDFTLYLSTTEKETKRHKVKSSILLHYLGRKGREMYNTYVLETKEKSVVFDKTIEKISQYCIPRESITLYQP